MPAVGSDATRAASISALKGLLSTLGTVEGHDVDFASMNTDGDDTISARATTTQPNT